MPASTPTDTQRSRLQALIDLSALALRASSIEHLVNAAVRAVSTELAVPRVGVFELIGVGEAQVRLRWGLGWRADQPGSLSVPAAAVIDGDEPVQHGDALGGHVEPLLAIGMIRGITVPISLRGGAYGVLGCFTDDLERSFDDDEVRFLRSVGDLLGAAIERAKAEESLRSSRQRLAMAQRIAHMGSYDWHIASDTNVWSDELYRIYGTEPQSFNASYERFLSFVHPDDRERIVAVHRRALQTAQPFEMEERIIRPDGRIRILETNGEVITDDNGTPVRMVGICFDVTEQRAAAEAARKYEEMRRDRGHALEINDNVVQGLATIVYALEQRRLDLALAAADRTLVSVREMINDLLTGTADDPIVAGSLRRLQPAAASLGPRRPDGVPPAPGAIRVLIADDSDDMRLMLRLALEDAGRFEVVGEAHDGAEALRVAEGMRPDVVLLDLAMPGMDGFEVARGLRALSLAAKIVVMSGFDAARMAPLALEHGATMYVEKGTSLEQLVASLVALFAEQPEVREGEGAISPRRTKQEKR